MEPPVPPEPESEATTPAGSSAPAETASAAETAPLAETASAGNRRRLAAVLAGGSVVLVLVVGFLVWPSESGPAEVVRGYLDAILHRKVDQALRVARADLPKGDAARFLTAAAIGGNWRFDAPDVDSDDDGTADVSVTLTDTSGRPTPFGRPLRGQFHLVKDKRGWRIDNPLVPVTFHDSPLRYIDVNGVRAARTATSTYQMFPGIYRTYVAGSDQVAITPGVVYAVSQEYPHAVVDPTVAVTDRGTRQFQQAAKEYLDRCLAQQGKPGHGCEIAVVRDFYVTDEAVVVPSDVTSSTWTVTRYPTVNLPGGRSAGIDGQSLFAGQVAIPGELHLAATGKDIQGKQVSFQMTCLVDMEGIAAGIAQDGSLSVTTVHGYRQHTAAADWIGVECL